MKGINISDLAALRVGLAATAATGLALALNAVLEPGAQGYLPVGRERGKPRPKRKGFRLLLTFSLAALVQLGTKDPIAALVALPVLWGVAGVLNSWGEHRSTVEGARAAREMVGLLADAAAVHPNIYEALQAARPAFPEPWRSEVETALGLLRATPGATLASQFVAMAERTQSREVALLAKILQAAENRGEVREQLVRLDLLLQRHQALGDRRQSRVAGHQFLIGIGLLAAPVGFFLMYLWARPWWTVDTTAPAGKVAVVVAILGETALLYLPRVFPVQKA